MGLQHLGRCCFAACWSPLPTRFTFSCQKMERWFAAFLGETIALTKRIAPSAAWCVCFKGGESTLSPVMVTFTRQGILRLEPGKKIPVVSLTGACVLSQIFLAQRAGYW